MKIVIHLSTIEEIKVFFELTGFLKPERQLCKMDWKNEEDTVYDFAKGEFGSLVYYKNSKYSIMNFKEFMSAYNAPLDTPETLMIKSYINSLLIMNAMKKEEIKQKYFDGIHIWGSGSVIDRELFIEWLQKQSVEVLKYTYKMFEKKHAFRHCFLTENVLEIKKLLIIKRDQYN